MLRRYATREEIAASLAPYKKNEIVTLLTDHSTEDGTYIKGTKFRVKKANFRLHVSVPTIYIDEVQNYYIDGNINQAIYYELVPLSNDKEYLFCENCDFEKGDIAPDELSEIYKRKNACTPKEKIGMFCFVILCIATIFLCIFSFRSFDDMGSFIEDRALAFFYAVCVAITGFVFATIPYKELNRIRVRKIRSGKKRSIFFFK